MANKLRYEESAKLDTVSYEEINNGEQIQVFVNDYYAGTLIKCFYPDKPDPQGRMFVGPWVFDGTDCQMMLGWPAIREVTMKIEHLNTHWNWSLQNAGERKDSPENAVPIQGGVSVGAK